MSSIGEAEGWEAVEREDELLPGEDAMLCLTTPVSAPALCPVLPAAAPAAPVVDDHIQSLLPDTSLQPSPDFTFEHALDIVTPPPMEDLLQDDIISTIGEEDPLHAPAEQGPGAFQVPHPPTAAAAAESTAIAEVIPPTAQLVDIDIDIPIAMHDPVQVDNPTPLHSLTTSTQGEDIPHPNCQEAPKAPEASLAQDQPQHLNNPTEEPVPAAAPNDNDIIHPAVLKDAPKEPVHIPQVSKVNNPPTSPPQGPTNTKASAPTEMELLMQAIAKSRARDDATLSIILWSFIIMAVFMLVCVPALLYYDVTTPNGQHQQQRRLASSAELLQQWYQQHQSCSSHHHAGGASDLTNTKPHHNCPAPGGLPLREAAREFQLTTNNGKSCLSSAHGLGQQLTLVACSSGMNECSLLEHWRERKQHQLFTMDEGRIVSAKGRYCLESLRQGPGAAAFKLAPCVGEETKTRKTFEKSQQWVFSTQGVDGSSSSSLQLSPLTASGLCVEVAQGYRPGCHLLPGTFEQELVLGTCSQQEDQAFAPAYVYPLP